METKPIKITLFYVTWCHFCNDFKPIWEQMINNKATKKNFKFEEYDCDDPKNKKFTYINGKIISSYPTIKIEILDFNEKEKEKYNEYQYRNNRTQKDIFRYVIELLSKINEQKKQNEEINAKQNKEINVKGGDIYKKDNDAKKQSSSNILFSKNVNNTVNNNEIKLSDKVYKYSSEYKRNISESNKLLNEINNIDKHLIDI